MHLTMKELPRSEQPYERYKKYGVTALSDVELLAIILKNGTKEFTSLELAREILRVSEDYSVLALCDKSYDDFLRIPGIGPVKAMSLVCISELSRRIHKSSRPSKSTFSTPKELAEQYMESMRHLRKEQLTAVFFDGGGRLLSEDVISIGTVNRSLVSPREILFRAFELQAVYFILIHNHPSGDPTPSHQDIQVTNSLISATELIGIPILDHIIIGDRKYVSLREAGVLQFEYNNFYLAEETDASQCIRNRFRHQ